MHYTSTEPDRLPAKRISCSAYNFTCCLEETGRTEECYKYGFVHVQGFVMVVLIFG
jgi:hypothetical protein